MLKHLLVSVLALALAGMSLMFGADSIKFEVHPGVYDPADTDLVQSSWLNGTGCPTAAGISTTGGKKPDTTYTDPACPTGDPKDKQNEGLLLFKTGPTGNYAAALADITGLPKNTMVTELGYDIRKPNNANDPRGSHCGAGAPRFNIQTEDGNAYFIGCNSPPAVQTGTGNGWIRLRWGGSTPGSLMGYSSTTGLLTTITSPVRSIQIVFDDGQDAGPDNFGAAILDNIDINGVMVGQGPGGPSH